MGDGITGIQEPFTYKRMPANRLTPELRARIVELHRAGQTPWQIAVKIDMGYWTVCKVLKEAN